MDSALVIGTQQSKQHFAGKAKVGIGIEALQTAIAEGTAVANQYFLFAHGKDLDESIVALAEKYGVNVVPSVNVFHYPAGEHLERSGCRSPPIETVGRDLLSNRFRVRNILTGIARLYVSSSSHP